MTSEQQAVPVAPEEREAADKAFDLAFRGDTNGIDDAMAQLFADHRALPCKSGEGAGGSVPDGWTLEQGRPAATAPYACHVLGGRLDETACEWVMAVVSTPLTAPFTHWWPLPGATIIPLSTPSEQFAKSSPDAENL